LLAIEGLGDGVYRNQPFAIGKVSNPAPKPYCDGFLRRSMRNRHFMGTRPALFAVTSPGHVTVYGYRTEAPQEYGYWPRGHLAWCPKGIFRPARFGLPHALMGIDHFFQVDWIGNHTGETMLWTIVALFLILWLLGFSFSIGGSMIHLLLVVALVVMVFNLISGRRGAI
jgi:hypothetical protein